MPVKHRLKIALIKKLHQVKESDKSMFKSVNAAMKEKEKKAA